MMASSAADHRDGPQAQTQTSEDFLPAAGTATAVQGNPPGGAAA